MSPAFALLCVSIVAVVALACMAFAASAAWRIVRESRRDGRRDSYELGKAHSETARLRAELHRRAMGATGVELRLPLRTDAVTTPTPDKDALRRPSGAQRIPEPPPSAIRSHRMQDRPTQRIERADIWREDAS